MENSPLQKITEQINEIESAIYECDLRGDSAGVQLPLIQNVFDGLMAASADTLGDDHQSRVKLARLEYRMRRCREALLMRNALAD